MDFPLHRTLASERRGRVPMVTLDRVDEFEVTVRDERQIVFDQRGLDTPPMTASTPARRCACVSNRTVGHREKAMAFREWRTLRFTGR